MHQHGKVHEHGGALIVCKVVALYFQNTGRPEYCTASNDERQREVKRSDCGINTARLTWQHAEGVDTAGRASTMNLAKG